MKKALLIFACFMAIGTFAFAADHTITPVAGKSVNVGGLPIFITFQSDNVGTADSVKIDAPAGFIPDVIFGHVASTTSNENIGCEWHKGMGDGTGIVIVNGGDRVYTAAAAVDLDNVNFNFSFGAECHTDAKPFKGWAARYAQ